MEINYGVKKVWNDLIESKENLKYFYIISVSVIILSAADVFFKVKICSWVTMLILNGYFALIMNNIIKDKKPVLEDLSNASGDRNLFVIILKRIGIDIIYGLALLLFGVPLFFVLTNLLKLNTVNAGFALVILLLPLLILISFYSLLFAENLKFADAFNIGRVVESIKKAWKKYLLLILVYIGIMIALTAILVVISIPFSLLLFLGIKGITIPLGTLKLIGDIIASAVGGVLGIAIGYWYANAVAQVYKYSIEKTENVEN